MPIPVKEAKLNIGTAKEILFVIGPLRREGTTNSSAREFETISTVLPPDRQACLLVHSAIDGGIAPSKLAAAFTRSERYRSHGV